MYLCMFVCVYVFVDTFFMFPLGEEGKVYATYQAEVAETVAQTFVKEREGLGFRI